MNEMEIKKKSSDIRNLAESAVVQNRYDLEDALEMLKTIKKHKTMIAEYWKEAKESAKKTYQNIVSKERQMLDICERCETDIKDKILKYDMLKKSYENKLLKEADMDRMFEVQELLEEAKVLEERGDLPKAEEKFKLAEKLAHIKIDFDKEKYLKGLLFQERTKCEIVNNRLVPSFFKGLEIREINTKKILEIKHKNPEINIPGIKFYKEKSVAIRV
jgi:hypothetical protein